MLVLNIAVRATPAVAAVGCAVNIRNSYSALKVWGAAMFQVNLPVDPDLPDCGADSKCIPSEEAIEAAKNEVIERYNAMLMDTNCLYPFKPGKNPNRPRAGTWPGHQWWFVNKAQEALKAAIDAAEKAGCPIPPDAEYWATIPPPICPAGRIPF